MAAVRRALGNVDGVLAAEVSLAEGRAKVHCRLDFDTPQALVEAVTAAGFQAAIENDDQGQKEGESG